MRFIFKTIVIGLLFFSSLSAKKNISIDFYFNNDTCKSNELSFIVGNDNNIYDRAFIILCNKLFIIMLDDISVHSIEENECAYLVSGTLESFNFEILIYDPIRFRYSHKLNFNKMSSKAVLEDYMYGGSEPSSYEEADNYFYTQQMGDLILITKKAEIDVFSVSLCSLDGRIISFLQNVEGWSQFSFDMFGQSSSVYLIRFIGRDKSLTKRVIYLR
jgi:hypothetical protein